MSKITVKQKNILSVCEEGAQMGLETYKVDTGQRHTKAVHVVEEKLHVLRFGLSILYFHLSFWGSWSYTEGVREDEKMSEKDMKKIPIVHSVSVSM